MSKFLHPESRLVADCYPKSKLLLTLAPDYQPPSQELSRLTYTASNKPGRLNKLGEELERRAVRESAKAGYNLRSRASLLLTLAILKALCAECRRDLGLFSRSVLVAINAALSVEIHGPAGEQTGKMDLEILARVGSLFAAFTTYTNSASVGHDDITPYLKLLGKFSALAVVGLSDKESRVDPEVFVRARLIGLAALSSAVASDALYVSGQYKRQVQLILPSLVANLVGASVHMLTEELTTNKPEANSQSPYFTSTTRPPMEKRRALSIYAHVDGETGPKPQECIISALRVFKSLFSYASASQLLAAFETVVDYLDNISGWKDGKWCCWLIEAMTGLSMVQYRFAVPNGLMAALVDLNATSPPSHKEATMTAAALTILTSRISLIGISTAEILNSLISLIFRRLEFGPADPLIPSLTESIHALGIHIYYADQVNDICEELAGRMISVAARGQDQQTRTSTLVVLMKALEGLIITAEKSGRSRRKGSAGAKEAGLGSLSMTVATLTTDKIPGSTSPKPPKPKVAEDAGTRNRIAPESLQFTLPLLCDSELVVRTGYAKLLELYLTKEISEEDRKILADEADPEVPAGEPVVRPSLFSPEAFDAPLARFLNSLNAAIYTLSLSSKLGVTQSGTDTPSETEPQTSTITASSYGKFDHSATASLRQSLKLSLPAASSFIGTGSASSSARPVDYLNALIVLCAGQERVPVQMLISSTPMLIQLDAATGSEPSSGSREIQSDERNARCRATKEVLGKFWAFVGEGWDIPALKELAETSLSTLAAPSVLPSTDSYFGGTEPQDYPVSALKSTLPAPFYDSSKIVILLSASKELQAASGLDEATLFRKLSNLWTVDGALRHSVEQEITNVETPLESPFMKISGQLMQIENASHLSFHRNGIANRDVGVGDLRDALATRSSMSTTNLQRTPSASTAGTRNLGNGDSISVSAPRGLKVIATRRTIKRAPEEVTALFQKLGIGKEKDSLRRIGATDRRKATRFASSSDSELKQ